jgi:hypothetical protein
MALRGLQCAALALAGAISAASAQSTSPQCSNLEIQHLDLLLVSACYELVCRTTKLITSTVIHMHMHVDNTSNHVATSLVATPSHGADLQPSAADQ